MSRNFELLNQMGKTPVMLPPEAELSSAPAPEAAAFIAPLEMDGMAREEITKLVHRLFLLGSTEAPRRVAFTATEPGNGNTWMCARVGEILASQVGRSVCIVDCNLRTPSLHQQFGVENHHGLSDALRGEGPIRQYARQLRRNLWLVSCGASSESAQELLTSDRMRMRIAELGAEFDYVLLDVAALNASNDGVVLGHLVDGVALVLKANSSRRDSTRDTIQLLQASNVRVLGAVLNQRTFPIPERIYNRL
ncbi:MAG: CpsD/CapB family tyrosine-protein kinase [Acidobacteriia bacterium]|nr:CpsD/CapB family tyrosine-protein kinase [Terriglobia bacterium]